MILYLDTSSLVKLYIEEDGSDRVELEVDRSDQVITSRVTYVEVRSAFARAAREVSSGQRDKLARTREVAGSQVEYAQLLTDFESDWRRYAKVNVSASLIQLAGDLAEKHALRGYDAVHLASVIGIRDRISDSVLVSTWDVQLGEAALAEGFQVAHQPSA